MLRGRLVEWEGNQGTIDVRDVGYQVFAPTRTLRAWSGKGQVQAFVVSELVGYSLHLYGFSSKEDRAAYGMLREGVGLGSRLALAVLTTMSSNELHRAVAHRDFMSLTRVPGVTQKLADRICQSLQANLNPTDPRGGFDEVDPSEGSDWYVPDDDENTVIVAMARMGYQRTEIERVQSAIGDKVDATAPIAERLQAALKILHGGD